MEAMGLKEVVLGDARTPCFVCAAVAEKNVAYGEVGECLVERGGAVLEVEATGSAPRAPDIYVDDATTERLGYLRPYLRTVGHALERSVGLKSIIICGLYKARGKTCKLIAALLYLLLIISVTDISMHKGLHSWRERIVRLLHQAVEFGGDGRLAQVGGQLGHRDYLFEVFVHLPLLNGRAPDNVCQHGVTCLFK